MKVEIDNDDGELKLVELCHVNNQKETFEDPKGKYLVEKIWMGTFNTRKIIWIGLVPCWSGNWT